MGKIKIVFTAEVVEYLNDLTFLLYKQNYFSFEENAQIYVQNIYDFIENSIENFPHKLTPSNLKLFGTYYIFYKANHQTSWFIFFQSQGDCYLITHVTNNHLQEIKDL